MLQENYFETVVLKKL